MCITCTYIICDVLMDIIHKTNTHVHKTNLHVHKMTFERNFSLE